MNFVVFFKHSATTGIYTLSLHDALPISTGATAPLGKSWCTRPPRSPPSPHGGRGWPRTDRKSTRLNSSHSQISYAVFCLKKNILANDCSAYQNEQQDAGGDLPGGEGLVV